MDYFGDCFRGLEEKTFVEKNEECIRFTVDIVCCRTSIKSKHHKTDCLLHHKSNFFFEFIKRAKNFKRLRDIIFF